jgi:nitrogen regulatory protein P-II 1
MQRKHIWSNKKRGGRKEAILKKIDAIIRAERLSVVKEQLKSLGISGMTVYSVSGWSRGKDELLQWKGQPVVHDLIAKSKLEIVLPDDKVDMVINTISESARTGEHGDGIIFVLPVEQAVNIKNMTTGEQVLR